MLALGAKKDGHSRGYCYFSMQFFFLSFQSLFVPDDQGDKSVIKEPPSEPVVKPPLPLSNKVHKNLIIVSWDWFLLHL